jgi:hypothetical protein
MEATAGIEPAVRVLQTPALPLGYVAVLGATPGDRFVPGTLPPSEWLQNGCTALAAEP